MELYIQRLVESNPLREPLLRTVIQALQLPRGSRGLDAGCGIGLQALLLAEAVGPDGLVTGLDVSPELLRHARGVVRAHDLAGGVSFVAGDVGRLPFSDASFDWVWSADCVGYPVGDLLPVLRELARVVRPGGMVIILAWTSQNLLPGYPLLEARLNATCSAFAPYVSGKPPESNFLRAPRWFHTAGLQAAAGRTFVGEVQAPLSAGVRTALVSIFDMLWGEPQPGVSPDDWTEYQRLCQPGSPDFILAAPGYYAYFTYTAFHARVPLRASPE